MIIELNICDVCESKKRIEEQSNHGLKMRVELIPDYLSFIGAFASGAHVIERTFCSKQCMLEFFQNTTDKGLLEGDDKNA